VIEQRRAVPIRTVLTGKVKPIDGTSVRSGIDKYPIRGSTTINPLGLEGDRQADLRFHGGADKAVHIYPWPHYALWQAEFPEIALFGQPGAFGENLSVDFTEYDVCIGDVWLAGAAEIQVTQGRQPCWKLNLRFGIDDMSARVQATLRTGWYCRVLKAGTVQSGDALELLHRPYPTWTIARLLTLIRDRECGVDTMNDVLSLPLTASWRKLFQTRRDAAQVEDWNLRLLGKD
jgi:MOSC domain-containing protein YiiM